MLETIDYKIRDEDILFEKSLNVYELDSLYSERHGLNKMKRFTRVVNRYNSIYCFYTTNRESN